MYIFILLIIVFLLGGSEIRAGQIDADNFTTANLWQANRVISEKTIKLMEIILHQTK